MRWILCGKNDAGTACLEYLVERGDEVWAIGTAGDTGVDGWQRSFRGAARRLGVRFDRPRRINDPAVMEGLAQFGARALLSVQYDQILRAALLERVGCACLNFHFALLPRHRGVSTIAWAILDGDSETGVTLHHMVVEVDAGDVIEQRTVAIRGDDTARDLYERVAIGAVDLFRDSYPFDDALLRRRLAQNTAVASYHREGDLDFSRVEVDWRRPAADLQRWIRAMVFPPLQHPHSELGGRRFTIRRIAEPVLDVGTGVPGEVLAKDEGGLDIAAADGAIRVTELRCALDPDLQVRAVLAGIPLGARFRSAAEEGAA